MQSISNSFILNLIQKFLTVYFSFSRSLFSEKIIYFFLLIKQTIILLSITKECLFPLYSLIL